MGIMGRTAGVRNQGLVELSLSTRLPSLENKKFLFLDSFSDLLASNCCHPTPGSLVSEFLPFLTL